MIQDETYFGAEKQFLVVIVPQSMKDKRDEIEALLADLQAQGAQEVEELGQAVEEWILTEGAKMAEGILERAWGGLTDAACSGIIIWPVALGLAFYWTRRRPTL